MQWNHATKSQVWHLSNRKSYLVSWLAPSLHANRKLSVTPAACFIYWLISWWIDWLRFCCVIGLLRRWSSSAITRVPWRVCCWKNPSSAFALRTTSTGEFLALSSKSNKWQRQMCCSALSRTHYTGQWIVYQNTTMHFYHKSIYSSHSDYFVGAFHVSFWFIWNLCVLSSQIFTGQESCNPSSIDRQCLTCLILFIGWCIYRNRSQS